MFFSVSFIGTIIFEGQSSWHKLKDRNYLSIASTLFKINISDKCKRENRKETKSTIGVGWTKFFFQRTKSNKKMVVQMNEWEILGWFERFNEGVVFFVPFVRSHFSLHFYRCYYFFQHFGRIFYSLRSKDKYLCII